MVSEEEVRPDLVNVIVEGDLIVETQEVSQGSGDVLEIVGNVQRTKSVLCDPALGVLTGKEDGLEQVAAAHNHRTGIISIDSFLLEHLQTNL